MRFGELRIKGERLFRCGFRLGPDLVGGDESVIGLSQQRVGHTGTRQGGFGRFGEHGTVVFQRPL